MTYFRTFLPSCLQDKRIFFGKSVNVVTSSFHRWFDVVPISLTITDQDPHQAHPKTKCFCFLCNNCQSLHQYIGNRRHNIHWSMKYTGDWGNTKYIFTYSLVYVLSSIDGILFWFATDWVMWDWDLWTMDLSATDWYIFVLNDIF